MESRHELYQGGIEPRQEQGHSDGSFLSPGSFDSIGGKNGLVRKRTFCTSWKDGGNAWGNPVGACKGFGGDRASHGSHIPGGDRALHGSHSLPGGDRALHGSHSLPGGDRALHGSHGLPGSDRALHGAHGLSGGDRVLHGAHGLSGGVRADGSGASEQPGGGRAAGMGGLCGGDKAPGEDAFDLFGEVPVRAENVKETIDREGARDRVGGREGLQQSATEAEERDTLKATTVVLPSLPSVAGKDAGLACGDWLAQVRPLMGDIAVGALSWWDCVVAAVTGQYYRWLEASPLDRLRITAPDPVEYNTTASRKRMELRASAIILAALPGSLKEEVVSSRLLSTGELLYKILRECISLGGSRSERKLCPH